MTRYHATSEGPVPFTPEEEAEWDAMEAELPLRVAKTARMQRDQLLAGTDWSQAVDTPQSIKDKYAPYRQALRDVPQQPGFPDNITWPTKPE